MLANFPMKLATASAQLSSQVRQSIIASAARSPSAENMQPWRLEWDDSALEVSYDSTRALQSDPFGMLGMTAFGALLESIDIAASGHSLSTSIDAQPLHECPLSEPKLHVEFRENFASDELSDYLHDRCTTRRMERSKWVHEDKICLMKEAAKEYEGAKVDFIPPADLRCVAGFVAFGNRLRFENPFLYEELTRNIRYTPSEAEKHKDGLDIRNLQLPFGVASIMRCLRSWEMVRIANCFGYSRMVELQAYFEVMCSGGIGIISVPDNNLDSMLAGGRAFQRVWLEATRQSIALHPVASLPVSIAYTHEGGLNFPLSAKHLAICNREKQRFLDRFPSLGNRFVQIAFRVGYGAKPLVQTLRRQTREPAS